MRSPLLPLELLHAISVATWHPFFAAFGYPASLSRATASHEDIAVAIDRPAGAAMNHLPPTLRAGFAGLRELAPWPGREAIYDAATVRGVDTTAWPHELGDAELAAWPHARGRHDLRRVRAAAAPHGVI
jgi:hypothetical protein